MTDEQREILTILSEECAEVIQAISKMLRFGVDSVNPYTGDVNKARLEDELTDVIAIIGILGMLDVVDNDRIVDPIRVVAKIQRLLRPGILKHKTTILNAMKEDEHDRQRADRDP